MNDMHDIHSRFAADLTGALSAAFGATGVNVQWPVFGAGSVYPPPDTPPQRVILPTTRYTLYPYYRLQWGH